MSRRQLSVFTFERARGPARGAPAANGHDHGYEAVMAMLKRIDSRLSGDEPEAEPGQTAVSEQFLADYKAGMDQVMALKGELVQIESAIEQTKREIASLHTSAGKAENLTGVTDELDEVVRGTEQATDSILEATEVIEGHAGSLAAALNRDGDRNMAYEIQEHATRIFEACNFQDLTGQRINKVVNTLRFIEERVTQMIDIWGGIDAFKDVSVVSMPNPAGPDEMLNGPGSEDDPARASQDDIDALFA